MGRVAGSASPASRLPQVSGAAQARDGAGCRVSIAGKPAPTGIGCSAGQGWGRLRSQHRRQAGSHRYWVQCRPCGRWLARDGAGCRVSIAGKPAPTGNGCSAGQGWGRLQDYHRRKPPLRVKTPSASRCCFCVQPLWAHRRNNPGAGLSAGDCGKCPGAFRKWCTCATCDPGTGSRYCSCAAG